MPIAVPFFQSKGLSMQEVFSLQALFAVAVLAMEVPSGYLADRLGRKPTLIIGAVCVWVAAIAIRSGEIPSGLSCVATLSTSF